MYLENDPSRSDPSWGIALAAGLFLSSATVLAVDNINRSITSIWLEGRISIQLNSLLFAKTLVKKDIAAGGDKKDGREKAEDAGGGEGDEEEEEDFSSKSQIMVRRWISRFRSRVHMSSFIQNLFTVDVERVNEFIYQGISTGRMIHWEVS
jgi:hypothetical protein